MSGHTTRVRKRAAAVVPVLALAAAGMATAGGSGAATAAPQESRDLNPVISGSEHYINYVEPRIQGAFDTDNKVGDDAKKALKQRLAEAQAFDAKHAMGNPAAAEELAALEAEAIETGKSPMELKGRPGHDKKDHLGRSYKKADENFEAQLLTILVEFNDTANDDFTGVHVPSSFGSDTCELGTVQNGPLHNNIPNPATYTHKDNNSMWVEDFSSEFYNKLLYTDEGITERVRTDLTGPDGEPGIDISGYTMTNMYEEMSHGAYSVSGAATPWITVPHSEGWYGATTCYQDEEGTWVYDRVQGMQGHPDNPQGSAQLPIDAVAALAKAKPDFPWSDYDIEDQTDRDGDGNYYEPNGVIDHVVLVHAGEDKSGGGGAQGPYAIWAHSSAVAGGATVPGTDMMISNYIVQPENSGVGVFAHEYGHDLGLPDLYDTSGAGSSDIDFWDLMSAGSHSGPIFQSMPTHMGIWDKWVLGWVDPVEVNPGDDPRAVMVGQNSRPLKGSADGIKVNLPDKVVTIAEPHSGEDMWYTGADQSWADVRVARDLGTVPADAKFWMWNNYEIESDWDYGFVEVSTDGGSTWTEMKVYDEAGAEVTTGDNYADPNGNLATFGAEEGEAKKYALTGSSNGWAHQYVDLSAYAGQDVQVRLRYGTDAAWLERGWFSDDFSLTSGTQVIWSDDTEGDDAGWTTTVDTFVNTTGKGWHQHTGTTTNAQFYMVEWRNLDGFDEGLKYAYDTTYSAADGAWNVQKVAYNAPGALVWYRDAAYGDTNHVNSNTWALPSMGAKGGLLLVDSHFNPLRRTGEAAELDPTTLKNMPSRIQSSNAAFSEEDTYEFTECLADDNLVEVCETYPALEGVDTFTDDKGWVPGLEFRNGGFYYRDRDASVVVPSVGVAPYTTRVVDAEGNPATALYGEVVAGATLGSGDPADAGVGYGTIIEVKRSFWDNRMALIKVTPPSVD